MKKRKGYIYLITNPSGSQYVGQTVNLSLRKCHYRKLHCKKQKHLYASLVKHGFDNHKFEIIEECVEGLLNERESYWIDYYDTFNKGMNLTTGGENYKRSPETNKILSNSKMGEKNPMYGKTGLLHHRYGKKVSKDTLDRLKESHIGINTGSDNGFFKGFVEAYKDNVLIGRFEGVHNAANKLNLHHPLISKVILGKRKTTGGYTFKRIAQTT